ncbi:MAG TPA: hypothetical protein VFI54_06350 [Solirubrobacteraceae bacterium]|nr:hypothetical protein [Solirubrobacteraceae bacterium]
MPAAIPLADYNTGYTSGMNSGTTQTLSSGAGLPAGGAVGGNANIVVAALVGGSLLLLLVSHLLGFRFGFDVSVGRRG